MKRTFDILLSIIILLIFLPIGLIMALWILFESKGGVFYRQERIGKFGNPFLILKFRSMLKDADKSGKLTIGRDPRITQSGHFLRKFKFAFTAFLRNFKNIKNKIKTY